MGLQYVCDVCGKTAWAVKDGIEGSIRCPDDWVLKPLRAFLVPSKNTTGLEFSLVEPHASSTTKLINGTFCSKACADSIGTKMIETSVPMSDDFIQTIKAMAKAAYPGPWGVTKYSGGFDYNGPEKVYANPSPDSDEPGMPTLIPHSHEDFIFIASARSNVPALADECLRRGKMIMDLEGIIAGRCAPKPI